MPVDNSCGTWPVWPLAIPLSGESIKLVCETVGLLQTRQKCVLVRSAGFRPDFSGGHTFVNDGLRFLMQR